MTAEPKGLAVVPSRFNPREHLRQLKGRGGVAEYLDVKWRLVWLRDEHPDAAIESEKVEGGIESNYAVFKARVSIPGGGSATGWGSETKADFGDFLEKAETKAIGRALAALGYGTQFAPDLDEGERIADSPVERRAAPPRPAPPATPEPAAVALTDAQERVIAQAWEMAEAKDTYAAVVALIRTVRADATPEQWALIKEVGWRIQQKHYPQTTKAAQQATG